MTDTFFDRFVHPRLAVVATAGALLWGGSFLLGAAGVVLRGRAGAELAPLLFFASGVVGLAGMVVLGACALWLAAVRVGRAVGARHT